MHIQRWVFGLMLLAAGPAQAALSGFHDSAEQIQLILQDPGVAAALKQLPIEQLESRSSAESRDTRSWRVRSQACELHVQLTAHPPAGPGKNTYQITQISACR